jgi:hypothetical protein
MKQTKEIAQELQMNNRTMISLRGILVLFAITSLLCCIAFADGDSRKPTLGEKEFNKSIMAALAKALPPGPEGWDKTGNSDLRSNLNEVYTEPNEPLRVDYYVAWKDNQKAQTAQMRLNEELMKLTQKPGFKGEGVEELQKKFEAKDIDAKIDVTANLPGSQSIYDKVTPGAAIGGGLVYQTPKALYIFLGKGWKTTTGGGTYVGFTPNKTITSSTVVQNIVVKIQAGSTIADQLARKIDWDALNALIKK